MQFDSSFENASRLCNDLEMISKTSELQILYEICPADWMK